MPNNPHTDEPQSEQQLVSRAQSAVSQCNWVVGECAAAWTKKYAKGRTDADFAALVGLGPEQVYQRRRVWETFSDVHHNYPSLKWSHFYVALKWDDAPECLQWAAENEVTVAEMKAWRRAQRGEDLTTVEEPDNWGGDPAIAFVPTEAIPVRDPDQFGGKASATTEAQAAAGDAATEPVSRNRLSAAREADGPPEGYAPYRQGAGSPAPQESAAATAVAEKPQQSASQLLKRLTMTVERINKALTPDMLKELRSLPEKKRDRLVKAVSELSSKTVGLI